jgi:hypothetical protein
MLRLPVVPPAARADGEFVWLIEVRQAGQFVGYRRLDTTYDAQSDTLQAVVALAERTDTLLLPGVLQPSFVRVTDDAVHLWSSPMGDADDFGSLSNPASLLHVVAPVVAGRAYVYDPASASYGWVDAASLASVELQLTQ